jgi:MFS family permease
MVGREDIPNAVALNSAMFNGARVVGPAVAGLTIGAFDISVAFLLNGLSFLAVIVAYLAMNEQELRNVVRAERARTVRDVVTNVSDGLAYVRRTDIVLLATVAIGLVATFGMNFNVLVPAFVDTVLHSDASGYGFLMAASGLGSLAAAMAIAFSARNRPYAIAFGTLVLAAGLIVIALTANFWVALVAMWFAGFGMIAMAATANTSIQLSVPDELRGRVMSVYTTVFAGSSPVGGLLAGWVASRFGVGEALLAGGLICVVVAVGVWVWLRRIGRAAQPRPVPAGAAAAVEASSLTTARPR